MNMLVLQNNIEIVHGHKNHCIYNFNTGKLYHLDSVYLDFLYEIMKNNYDKVEKEIIDYFIKEGIVVKPNEVINAITISDKKPKVDFAWVEVTQNCNLTCVHCYENASANRAAPEMSLNEFYKVIDFLVNHNIKRIQLVGGEPLTHPQIKEMIKYVSGKFSFIEIYTNGTLLDDGLITIIKQNNISLAFSLYSNESTIHDCITCVKGSHNLTSTAIKKTIENGINLRIAAVEMKNAPNFKYEVESIFRTDFPRLTGRAGMKLYNREMLRRKLITKHTFTKPIKIGIVKSNQKIHNCFGERLYIDCNLNVYPCVMERRITYGNIEKIKDSTIGDFDFAFLTKDKIEVCKDCEFRYACYDCRPDSNGSDILDKPWYCTYDPYKGEWLDTESFIDELLDNAN